MLAILRDPRTVERNPSDRIELRGEAAELVARWVRHWEEYGFGLVYRFVPEVWGLGFATEAAAAVLSRALDEMPAETIVARVRPNNRSSQNVALKAGLQRDTTMDSQGEDGLDWAFTNRIQ
ncbi:MAG: GNAT family N-acetyltransferase [Candidatus Saccharibacteria bacterium]|nr:GNAT family N-acetyltransferase [Microbacteriaceae bacterium]